MKKYPPRKWLCYNAVMTLEGYKQQLAQIISIKSISTDLNFKFEMQKAVSWLENYFKSVHFTTEIWQGPTANPVLFATYTVSPEAETVLVYGHYDVQPAEKADGWKSDPYELTEEGGRLYARGVVDNKGQFMIHAYVVTELIKQNKLKYNVQFIIEGNEETSNDDLARLIEDNKQKITADYIMISDGEICSWKPVIEYSLRGGFNCKLSYKTAKNNLHSGLYGGAVPNATLELITFVNNMYENNRVKMDWFYEGVDEITKEQIQNNTKAVSNLEETLDHIGVKKLFLDKGNDLLTQVGLMPTIQVTGFKSGYIGEGYSNIVPADAEVRLNFRSVMSQDNKKIKENFDKYVKEKTPPYVEYTVEYTQDYDAIKIDITSEKVSEVKELLSQAFETSVLTKPVGGGIPVVSDFKNVLGIDSLLVSLGNEDCNMHGVNENFHVDTLKKGLKFSQLFFSN